MKLLKSLTMVAVAALALSACDLERQTKLEEGVSTEADVRKVWGEPKTTWENADGTRTFEYPRQPEGQLNYFIIVGGDGKLVAQRQVLKPSEFAKVQAGMDKDKVRKTLGMPAKTIKYDLKPDEENWEWRWLDGQTAKEFIATFDRAGIVTKTQIIDDPKVASPGGK